MPSVSSAVFFAFQAAALYALVASPGSTSLFAVAKPLPMPLAMMAADSHAIASAAHHVNSTMGAVRTVRPAGHKSSVRTKRSSSPTSSLSRKVLRAARRTSKAKRSTKPAKSKQELYNEYYSQIKGYHSKLSTNAENIRALASRSSSVQDGDSAFTQSSASELTAFHANMLGLEGVLGNLGADKGLANYDRSNTLETILKDVVNLDKDVLSSITVLVYNLPIVGKTLGPIVYQIKCVLDTVLNTVENLADGLLNVLKPLLGPVIGGLFTAACHSGSGLNLSGCPL